MNFTQELKYSWKKKNNFNILIYLNLIVFIGIKFIELIYFFIGENPLEIVSWFAVPADLNTLIVRPWTIISYMFTHENFLHILFNLLAFYWFARMFLMYFSQRQLLSIYIIGGLSGALFYIVAFNLITVFNKYSEISIAIGASASVMAVVFSIALLVPNNSVYLLFFGEIKLKYIAFGFIVLDLVSIPLSNAGGHIAHIGGAFSGALFVYFYRKGTDITIWLSRLIYGIKEFFIPQKKLRIKVNTAKNQARYENDEEYNARKKAEQEEINAILDKISRSGYESLSDEEKVKLFNMSNRK
jgi:membrane associated rhomboid family serine protease